MKRLILLGLAMLLLGSFTAIQAQNPRMLKDIRLTGTEPYDDGMDFRQLRVLNDSIAVYTLSSTYYGVELWRTNGTVSGTYILKDIYQGSESSVISGVTYFNNAIYFFADDGIHGLELWKTDGTSSGTQMVLDLQPGINGMNKNANGTTSSPQLFATASTLYFTGNNGTTGLELWKTDGTTAGTVLVKDITSGTNGTSIGNFCARGSELFFTTGSPNGQLWKTDGTEVGTVVVKSLGASGFATNPILFNNEIYFNGNLSDGNGNELYKTDGTTAGTVLVKDINLGSSSSNPYNFTIVNNQLFFVATTNSTGYELFKTDGTGAGTVLVKDIVPGTSGSSPGNLHSYNNKLYFAVYTPTYGTELYTSDGTDAGTVLFKDIRDGNIGSNPTAFTNINNMMWFVASDTLGSEIWSSDGTLANTARFKDIKVGSGSGMPGGFNTTMVLINNKLLFSADDGIIGGELWTSDFTSAGTQPIGNLHKANVSSTPNILSTLTGNIMFSAEDGVNGRELWKSDGSSAGTVMVKNIYPNKTSSNPTQGIQLGNKFLFTANDSVNGVELMETDGTEVNTKILKDIVIGTGSSNPSTYIVYNGIAYFSAFQSSVGNEIWRSDGTEGGTYMLKDIVSGTGSSSVFNFFEFNNALYFFATDPSNTSQKALFKTDGTNANTVVIKQGFNFFSSSVKPVIIGSEAYFVASTSATGTELWKTDGTGAGTVLFKELSTGVNGTEIPWMGLLNNQLVFTANTYNGSVYSGLEIYYSDGTAAGTSIIKEFDASSGSSIFLSIHPCIMNNMVYFFANDPTTGTELWKSDGTLAGTSLVKDIHQGSKSAILKFGTNMGMASIDNKLYFPANNDTSGFELWVTDGSSAGTKIVSDIVNGYESSMPHRFFVDGKLLYFVTKDKNLGEELWVYDTDNTPPQKSLTLTAPNGGETYYINKNGTITWTSANIDSVNIEVKRGTGTYEFIGKAKAVNGSFVWNVTGQTADTCLVRISELGNPSLKDISNGYFAIRDSISLKLLYPNGGQTFDTSSVQNITWLSSNIDSVSIYYTTDNSNYTFIGKTLASNNGYSWKVPNIASTAYKIKVEHRSNPSLFDVSDSTFKVVAPQRSVQVLKPNGGESYLPNTNIKLKWSRVLVDTIILEYKVGNGNYTHISTFAGDSLQWNTGSIQSDSVKIRVRDWKNGNIMDESDGYFSIKNDKQVQVIYPNGGEKLYAGSNVELLWTSNAIDSIIIEIKRGNGAYQFIQKVKANPTGYQWTVDANYSDSCIVRMRDAADASVTDESDGYFAIKPAKSIQVLAPNGGEVYYHQDPMAISWSATSVDSVAIEVKRGTGPYQLIKKVKASTGSYTWNVDSIYSDSCLIRIKDVANASIFDINDNYFAIKERIQKTLMLLNPAEGGVFYTNSTIQIAWQSSNIDSIDIEIQKGTQPFVFLARVKASLGVYPWFTDSIPSDSVNVRIKDAHDASIFSESKRFRIIKKVIPSIVVTSPRGGKVYDAGESIPIQWNSTAVDTIYIVHDLRGSVEFIAKVPANMSSYSWKTPKDLGGTGTITLISVSDTAVYGQSGVISVQFIDGILNVSKLDIQLFPNPAQDVITLVWPQDVQVEALSIIDIQGKVLKVERKHIDNALDILDLESGVYFIHIHTDKGIGVSKFVKQ
jgi:ELWxxDGT repeat protein